MDTIFPQGIVVGTGGRSDPSEARVEHPGQRVDGAVVPTALLDDFRLTPAAMRYYAAAMREPELELGAIGSVASANELVDCVGRKSHGLDQARLFQVAPERVAQRLAARQSATLPLGNDIAIALILDQA